MSGVRDLVFAALSNDVQLNAMGIDADSLWAAGSFEGPIPCPFAVMRWGNVSKGMGPVNRAPMTLYVHDDSGDYTKINGILLRARAVMLALCASGTSANWIIDVSWDGDSADLSDDQYKTLMRTADFTVVANTL